MLTLGLTYYVGGVLQCEAGQWKRTAPSVACELVLIRALSLEQAVSTLVNDQHIYTESCSWW